MTFAYHILRDIYQIEFNSQNSIIFSLLPPFNGIVIAYAYIIHFHEYILYIKGILILLQALLMVLQKFIGVVNELVGIFLHSLRVDLKIFEIVEYIVNLSAKRLEWIIVLRCSLIGGAELKIQLRNTYETINTLTPIDPLEVASDSLTTNSAKSRKTRAIFAIIGNFFIFSVAPSSQATKCVLIKR